TLARAVSAWAQVVLDDVLIHASAACPAPAAAPPVTPAEPAEPEALIPGDGRGPRSAPDAIRPKDGSTNTYEVGTMLILRNGVASAGGIFGASPFMTVAFSEIWVLRPSLAIGTSTSRIAQEGLPTTNLTYAGGRIDFCRRIPGNYIDRRGIEVDVCAGGD